MRSPEEEVEQKSPPASLRALALLFLKLGTIGFGGPAAHIAMMEDEIVRRRRWLTRDDFLDLLGATNLIPGPNSTEMAIHIGHRQRCWSGLVVAGVCFILPAVLIVLLFAWIYVRYGSLPQVAGVLYGVKPVIIAIVLQALWSLWRTAMKNKFLVMMGVAGIVLAFLGVHELLILFGGGVIVGFGQLIRRQLRSGGSALLAFASPIMIFLQSTAATTTAFGLLPLFLFFLKVGAVLYGSGYVLLAFIRADLVERWQWLTESQLLDAIAVGQVTPGPVFTTATFIGYVLGGLPGAIVATVGIFLPAFVFVAVSGPLVPRIRRSPVAGAFLDGVNAASLALMFVVTYQLGRAAIIDVTTIILALASAVALFRFKLNSAWLILGGAIVGFVVSELIAR
ncbi:MAG TPA: chromate efflux transporter [Pyrinomonadaceae bacterium]|nr:chromate efflux transporter [Pyrinomonadaceae bacterium]